MLSICIFIHQLLLFNGQVVSLQVEDVFVVRHVGQLQKGRDVMWYPCCQTPAKVWHLWEKSCNVWNFTRVVFRCNLKLKFNSGWFRSNPLSPRHLLSPNSCFLALPFPPPLPRTSLISWNPLGFLVFFGTVIRACAVGFLWVFLGLLARNALFLI